MKEFLFHAYVYGYKCDIEMTCIVHEYTYIHKQGEKIFKFLAITSLRMHVILLGARLVGVYTENFKVNFNNCIHYDFTCV